MDGVDEVDGINGTEEIRILAIESSCDETAAAVVKDGREVLSNVIYSQIALHTEFGGVVPEIASRKHIEKINQVVEQALAEAGTALGDITAVAVTYGPGLVGALLVGVSAAKAISFATGIPLVGVHHIEGHISANFIENKDLEPPFVCLVVSGGHSRLPWCDGRCVQDPGTYSPRHSDPRLLAIPASCSRVADYNPNWGGVFGVRSASPLRLPLFPPL